MLIGLVDGVNFLFRSDFRIGIYKGVKRVSGIYNFIWKLKNIKEKEKIEKLIVCWDSGKSGRDSVWKDYKKGKQLGEDTLEILSQVSDLEKLLPELGVYSVKEEGIEADDLIYTIVKHYYDNKNKIFVFSTDKDFYQLLDRDLVYICNGGKKISRKNFSSLFGMEPEFYFIMKLIIGDPSDNIPGIKGVGEKTFKKILEEVNYKKDLIFKHSKIRNYLDLVERNLQLIKFKEVEFNFSKLERSLFSSVDFLKNYFLEIGFVNGLKNFQELVYSFKIKFRKRR
jgi:DNA polymerase-1